MAAATRFLARYREFAGETYPDSLAHHYVAYRAHVRVKVACLRHAQGDPDAAVAARSLLDLTARHLEEGRVRLVLVGGLPGTGKSTLAAGLADATGWSVLRSDEVRKDIAGLGHTTPAPAAPGEGLYRPELTDATYTALLDRARTALELGECVILDASWSDRRHREAAAEIARTTASDCMALQCVAPTAVAEERIRRRRASGPDPSDATPKVAAAMAARFAPWPEAAAVDTAAPVDAAVSKAQAAVRFADGT
jgi:predicted kinase